MFAVHAGAAGACARATVRVSSRVRVGLDAGRTARAVLVVRRGRGAGVARASASENDVDGRETMTSTSTAVLEVEKEVADADAVAARADKTEVVVEQVPSSGASTREIATVSATLVALAGAVIAAGGPSEALVATTEAIAGVARGLVENHAPGVGGIIEDSFLALLTVGTVYALWRSSVIPRPIGNPIVRKSRTPASWIHVVSGAGGLAMALYGVGLERIYRESPGWTWMWVSSAMFMANALSYGPLMSIFKASKEGKYAMQLGYSFVASFQGVVWIAWSAQPDAPDWMFWAVMPYWYFSLAKLWESTEFVLALTPPPEDKESAWAKMTSGSRMRLGRMTPDAATLTYVGLNAAAAVFDNCYMGLYTLLGPEQFWHTSQMFNDSDFHLRLIKGTTGSLTVALLIFISTLGWRKQMPMKYAIWLNVILGSVGPWIVLFWHKLLDPSENWFPQFVFDPAYDYHAFLNPAQQLFK
jgi:hypothetical protein